MAVVALRSTELMNNNKERKYTWETIGLEVDEGETKMRRDDSP